MEYHPKKEYTLPLGKAANDGLYGHVRGNTLYLYTADEPLGYTRQDVRPVQRTIDDFIDD